MPNPENLEGQGFHTDPDRINREGRPKGSKNMSTILREMLDEDVEIVVDGVKSKKKFADVIVRKLIKKANDGDIKAIQEVFDRSEGKAKQEVVTKNVNYNSELTQDEIKKIAESLDSDV